MSSPAPCPRCGTPLDVAADACPRCVVLEMFAPPRAGESPDSKLGDHVGYFGEFELLELIARGGMGVVYRARQIHLERIVAVKMIAAGVLPGDAAISRFQQEAAAAASLQHPNIVAIHEVGEHEGQHYFAMDYVAGPTLAALARGGPLPARRAAAYLRAVAEAVDYAHGRGVLHRDLKPSNILVDERDRPRVTDFGLAKRIGAASELTLSGQLLGTPAFMAPEQAEPKRGPASPRSDVYSLGAVLYELITGRAPFVGESPVEIIAQVLSHEPVVPRLLNPSVSRDLETICLKCLEKEPARRYGTARELAEDLGRFLADEPIHARPVGAAERGWRWCKRKPALAAALVGIALLLVGIAVVSSLATRRIDALRRDALTNLYASDMRLAQQAIAESKFGVARDLLQRHQPKPGDPDLRGFEWWHFQELCRSEETAAFAPHSNQVQRAAFSPDGRWCATAATDVQVWELPSRRQVLHFPVGDFVWSLAFSPDSRELLVGDGGGNVRRYGVSQDRSTNPPSAGILPALVLGTLTNLNGRPIAFCWPEKESGIRVVLSDGLLAWDGTTQRADRVADFGAGLARLQVSPDGRFGAALAGPYLVAAWRLNPPGLLKEFRTADILRAAAVSPDGSRLAAGGYSGALRIWELNPDGRTNVIAAHRGLIESVIFSPDGQWVASAGADQIIRVHEAASGRLQGEWRGHRGTVMALAFSPDGRWLVSGDKRGEVKLWDMSRAASNSIVVASGEAFLSDDGARVLTRTGSSSFDIRDATAPDMPGPMQVVSNGWWLLPSARAVAAIDADGQLEALQADGTWRQHSLGDLRAMPNGVLSPDGRFAALRVKESAGVLWDVVAAHEIMRGTNEPIWLSPTFSADSRRLAYGSLTGWVRVWEVPSGRVVNSFQAHTNNYAYACDLSPDGRKLATAGFDGVVRLWDIESARLLGEYRSPADAYWTVALSSDGRRIAAGTSESSIVLWDMPSRQEVATFQLGEPLGPVEGLLRFTPDGTALLRANGVLHHWVAPRTSRPQ